MNVPITKLAAVVCAVGVMSFGAAAQTMSIQQGGLILLASQYGVTTMLNDSHGDLNLDFYGSGNLYGWIYTKRIIVNGTIYSTDARISGNLYVTGVKSFIHPHPTDDSKVIKYIAIESGEALTLARGTAKTVNGEATVALPEHFSLSTSKDVPVTVILTPEGAPVLLYTKQKNKEKIVIAMKKSDYTAFGDVEFAFQVTGVRDGFEKQDIIVDVEKLYAPEQGKANNEVQKRIDVLNEKTKAITQRKSEK